MKTVLLVIIVATIIMAFIATCAVLFLLTKIFYELGQSTKEYKEYKREFDNRSVELKKEFDEQKQKVNRWLK